MVVSGIVSVRAKIGEREETASAQTHVTPRNWVDRIGPVTIAYYGCPGPLTADCPLPATPEFFHDLARFDPGPSNVVKTLATVLAGPNEGFLYIPGAESPVNFRAPEIQVNEVLRHPEDPFWRTRRDCNIAEVHGNVMAHEQIHVAGLMDLMSVSVTRGWIESFTAFGTKAQKDSAAAEVLRDYYTAFRNAADSGHTNPRFRDVHPKCDLKLDSSRRQPPTPGRTDPPVVRP